MIAAPLLLAIVTKTQTTNLNVFAAASLKEAFTTIAQNYEDTHPGVHINLNFAGSQLLAAQINGGAQADLFASADETNLDKIQFDKNTEKVFVKNRLVIVLRSDLQMNSLKDLPTVGRFVVADEAVPVGHYTSEFLQKTATQYGQPWLDQLQSKIVSKEQDVKAVLTKVELGEADAGVVYVSDAKTAKDKIGQLAIPEKFNEVATYPLAIPTSAADPKDAADFETFILSKQSQKIFENDGFLAATK